MINTFISFSKPAEDAQKYEDELMEEDLPGGTEGDEKAPVDEEQTEDDQNGKIETICSSRSNSDILNINS